MRLIQVSRGYVSTMKTHFDIIVIGAGHAGCEAACATARMDASTLLITGDMNKVAQLSLSLIHI